MTVSVVEVRMAKSLGFYLTITLIFFCTFCYRKMILHWKPFSKIIELSFRWKRELVAVLIFINVFLQRGLPSYDPFVYTVGTRESLFVGYNWT